MPVDGDPAERSRRIGELLTRESQTLAVAESCTGGLVSSLITDTPGASGYLDRAWVTYQARAKTEELGADRELLEQEGSVSEPVALAMAQGGLEMGGVDWAVATTGVLGPSGGTEAVPVGTVFIAVAGPGHASVERYRFHGDRASNKRAAATQALSDLLDELEEMPG